jgi:hypothetical protein
LDAGSEHKPSKSSKRTTVEKDSDLEQEYDTEELESDDD